MTRLPMLASASTATSNRQAIDVRKLVETGDWILDQKIDGVRAWLMPGGRILNRKGVDVTYKFPEVVTDVSEIVDGEIIAYDATFETTLVRESQENRGQIRRLAESAPCRLLAFDLPERDDTYEVRRRRLIEDYSMFGVTEVGHQVEFIDWIRDAGGEGVIAKRRGSMYQFGKRSQDWIKHKFVRRISCIGFAYSQGNGSRAHFGALRLALLKDGVPVEVGRTGSGFTDRETHHLKARLDASEYFVAEVEFLNVTSGGQLRFPVYRGIRGDVSLDDCTYEQLERS